MKLSITLIFWPKSNQISVEIYDERYPSIFCLHKIKDEAKLGPALKIALPIVDCDISATDLEKIKQNKQYHFSNPVQNCININEILIALKYLDLYKKKKNDVNKNQLNVEAQMKDVCYPWGKSPEEIFQSALQFKLDCAKANTSLLKDQIKDSLGAITDKIAYENLYNEFKNSQDGEISENISERSNEKSTKNADFMALVKLYNKNNYDEDIETIKCMIQTAALLKNKMYQTILCDFINRLPEKKYHQAIVEMGIEKLKAKHQELIKDGHTRDANAAKYLIDSLNNQKQCYFEENKMDKKHFQENCLRVINEAAPALEKHRGWKQVLANVSCFILGAGIFYVVAGLINLAKNNHFFFFRNLNKNANLVDEIQSEVTYTRPMGQKM